MKERQRQASPLRPLPQCVGVHMGKPYDSISSGGGGGDWRGHCVRVRETERRQLDKR